MTEDEMLEINLEVKMGTHRKGDPYPILNFRKFQYNGDLSQAPDPTRLIVSQEQVISTIEKLHKQKPESETIAFFYLAEADDVHSL